MLNNKITILAFLSALSISLFALEVFIPKPLPFIKIGLSNSIILFLIIKNKFKDAFIVALSKVFIGNLIVGTIFTPTFLLSLSGTLVAVFVMIIFKYSNIKFSILGISILGALGHNITQILVSRIILIKDNSVFMFIPLMILLSIFSGLISGYFAYYMINNFKEWNIFKYE